VWEELFTLPVKDLDADVLRVQVVDWDRVSKDDPIGDASVTLAHLVQGTMMTALVSLVRDWLTLPSTHAQKWSQMCGRR
jgi:Ca2+-dependent lipid-binding protein